MDKYLVTGGAGFIGSNLVRRLVSDGHKVTVLDNYSTGKPSNLAGLEDKIKIVAGDICDLSLVKKCVGDADYVLHQAAVPSVPRSIKDPLSTNRHNVEGTLNVLWAARESEVKRVVIASSSSVYGNSEELPKHEGMVPCPLSPYAISKLAGEHYARVFHQLYGVKVVILRYFNVFGPYQNPDSQYAAAIPKFIFCALRGAPIPIYGDGEQSRDFTFVANVVHANLLACVAPDASGNTFNVSTGNRYTLNEIVKLLGEILEKDVKTRYLERRAGDVLHSLGDISQGREKLGYEPLVDFRDGLRQAIVFFRELL